MKPTYLLIDDLDSRREIWLLLHRLPAASRLRYLEKCCRAVADGLGNGLFPLPSMWEMVREAERCERASDRLTNAVAVDLVHLAANRGLCLLAVALDLEQVAKGRDGCQPAALRAAPARSAVLAAV